MSSAALLSTRIHVGSLNLTNTANSVDLPVEADELDATTFASGGYRERKGGLRNAMLSHEGWVDFADPDATLFAQLGAAVPVSVAQDDAAASSVYLFEAMRGGYGWGGKVGDLTPYSGKVAGRSRVGRGKWLLPVQSATTNVTGSAFQLGAVPSGSRLLIAVHVFSAPTTATLTIESDNSSGFASAATVLTRTIDSTADTEWIEDTTVRTDDWFRARITSVTGTVSLAVSAAVVSS